MGSVDDSPPDQYCTPIRQGGELIDRIAPARQSASSSSSRRSGMRGCHSPAAGRITAPGSSSPQSTRIVQRKRRPTSNVDSMMVLRARRGGAGTKYVTLEGG